MSTSSLVRIQPAGVPRDLLAVRHVLATQVEVFRPHRARYGHRRSSERRLPRDRTVEVEELLVGVDAQHVLPGAEVHAANITRWNIPHQPVLGTTHVVRVYSEQEFFNLDAIVMQ